MRNRQAGLTLIETILVLMVAAIIIGGIWIAYSQVRINDQVQETVALVDETIAVAWDYLGTKSTSQAPATLSIDLYNQGLMPSRLSYVGTATNSICGWQVADFKAPLGDFFVNTGCSAPNTAGADVEIIVYFQPGSQCLHLLPELIGSASTMRSHGIVNWRLQPVAAVGIMGGFGSVLPLAQTDANWATDYCNGSNGSIDLFFPYRQ